VLFNYEPNTILELGSVQFTYPCKDHAAIESLFREWYGKPRNVDFLGEQLTKWEWLWHRRAVALFPKCNRRFLGSRPEIPAAAGLIDARTGSQR
jgi:hypothetical protein